MSPVIHLRNCQAIVQVFEGTSNIDNRLVARGARRPWVRSSCGKSHVRSSAYTSCQDHLNPKPYTLNPNLAARCCQLPMPPPGMSGHRDCHIEFTGDTLKMPISDDLMGQLLGSFCVRHRVFRTFVACWLRRCHCAALLTHRRQE